ncbi:ubiquitin carboxyl-terminal hydrolase 14 isoform X2, partial [Tanacetum coccineum]
DNNRGLRAAALFNNLEEGGSRDIIDDDHENDKSLNSLQDRVVFLKRTEMTTAEKELDQNTNFDWNRIQESGKEVEPLYGPRNCIIDKNAKIGKNVVIANKNNVEEADRSDEGFYIRSAAK